MTTGFVKIALPGETPWAEILATNDDGTFTVRIANKLFREYPEAGRRAWLGAEWDDLSPLPELHTFKQGDVLVVSQDDHGRFAPVPLVRH